MVEIDALSREILLAMSENCRRSISSLAKELHCSPQTLKKHLRRLEQDYEIRYTLELDPKELGLLTTYFVLVKFSSPPDEKIFKKALKQHPDPQFAALTKGDFDMIIYVVSRSALEFTKWANYFRQELGGRIERWEGGVVTGHWFGFFPLEDRIMDDLEIDGMEKLMLGMLMRNARTPLKDIARRTKLSMSTAQYHLKKLLSSKAVRRATLVMDKPPKLTHYVVTLGYIMSEQFLTRDLGGRNFVTSEGGYEPMNRLLTAFNVSATNYDDVVLYSFDNLEEAHSFHDGLTAAFKEELRESKYAFILTVLKGSLPCRKLNVKENYRTDFMGIYDYMRH